MDISTRLASPDLPTALVRLSFCDDDAAAVLAAVPAVLGDEASLERLADMVRRLAERGDDMLASSVFTPADATHHVGDGVLPLLALLATVPEALARHTARGIPDDVAWDSLADLGQQVWVHGQVHGGFGLHNQDWLGGNWAGGLVALGRLQFDVERLGAATAATAATAAGDEPRFFTHIPESGPLAPPDVDASLASARRWLPQWFPEVADRTIHCVSWLLDPTLSRLLPDSNIAAFAARFDVIGDAACGCRDAVYFGFHREPPCDLAELPRDSRLHRAVGDHLRAGGTFRLMLGRLR